MVTKSEERKGSKPEGVVGPKLSSDSGSLSDEEQNVKRKESNLEPGLYGRPVEEVDPFIFEDTFCIISKKYRKHYIYRFSATRSLFIFGPLNPIRKIATRIIVNQLFDLSIILIILVNCVTLAMATNFEIGTTGKMAPHKFDQVLENIEYVYLAVYTLEMLLKVIAKGFVLNKYSYLRNRWNILDFTVVISGYVTIILTQTLAHSKTFDLDFLRTFRVLRAVKTISIIPGLRTMINALLAAARDLVDVMALTIFCLMIFALLALELYKGKLRQKCVLIKNGSQHHEQVAMGRRNASELEPIDLNDSDVNRLWYNWVTDENNWLQRKDDYPMTEYQPCGNDTFSRKCWSEGFVCLENVGENYDEGWTSFDSFHSSMLSTFQLITLDFWERLYDLILSTTSPFHVFFFLVVIFLGSFYLLNLMLAVVAMSYDKEVHKADQARDLTKSQKLSLHRSASTFSFYGPTRLQVTLMTQYTKRTPSQRELIARTLRNSTVKPEDEEGGDKNKKPKFHKAILTLLGRRRSLASWKKKVHPAEAEDAALDETSSHDPEPNPIKSNPSTPHTIQSKSASSLRKPNISAGPSHVTLAPGSKIEIEKEEQKTGTIQSKSASSLRKSNISGGPSHVSLVTGTKTGAKIELEQEEQDKTGGEPITPKKDEDAISGQKSQTSLRSGGRRRRKRIIKCFKKIKKCLTPVVNHWSFVTVITFSILVNTILMASEHHAQPLWLDNVLTRGNYLFMTIFMLEAAIKILALQLDYVKSGWNIFDFLIVVMSIGDVILDAYNYRLSVIRALRLLRVFKLAQSWITMKILLSIIMKTFGQLVNLVLVLLIVLYIFAVLGLQYLGEYYTKDAFGAENDDTLFPRWNFQHFWYAFMMVFRVLCGEWIEPLWDCLKAAKKANAEYKCFIIYLPILVVGNFIVLNLFLALLLNSFDSEQLESQRDKELEALAKKENLRKIVNLLVVNNNNKGLNLPLDHGGAEDASTVATSAAAVNSHDAAATENGGGSGDSPEQVKKLKAKIWFKRMAKKVIMANRKAVAEKMIEQTFLKQIQSNAAAKTLLPKRSLLRDQRHSSFGLGRTESTTTVSGMLEKKHPESCIPRKCWSVNCFLLNCLKKRNMRRWDGAREWALKVISHPIFEWFILFLIFCSSATLCLEDVYLEKNAKLQQVLFYLNMCFTVIFILEMLLKCFALGLWHYFTNYWTLLDFFIVTISVTQLGLDIHSKWHGNVKDKFGLQREFQALKALRTLRALRPLRVISRWQGMKIVINALMYAIPSIFNVLLVCLLFWLIFSILGVQLFKGKFYRCVDNEKGLIVFHKLVKSKEECCKNTDKWSWINQSPNFDNVFQGYLTLFQVATFEGWMEAMGAAVDSTEVDQQPERDKNLKVYVYFVIFIVFGAFFTLNLFIGAIIDNFNRLKKKYEGNFLEVILTPTQVHYYTTLKKLARKKPKKVIRRPGNKFLIIFYDLAMSKRFEIAIFAMIFLNMAVMAFEYYQIRLIWLHILSGLNCFFISVYAIETIIKMIGLRQFYFTVPWNLFDFAIVAASIVDVVMGDSAPSRAGPSPALLRIVRIFRIGRVLRLIKVAKGIRKLVFALIVSLPALFNIGALLALITFIYAILGMALFGKIAKDAALDEVFNFETFLRSCLVLLRIMTSAGWNDVLSAMTNEPAVCGPYRKIQCGREGEGECANVSLAVFYMVSYLMISYLIVINMYIAIILENFVEAHRDEEIGIVEDDLETFYVHWSRFDPQATQFISFDQLSEFLASVDKPLGIPKPNIVAIVSFNIPIARGNKIHCLDILHALIRHVVGHGMEDTEELRRLQDQMEHKFRKQFPMRKHLHIISSTRVWKMQHNAAVTIQRAWRAYKIRNFPSLTKIRSMDQVTTLGRSGRHHHQDHTGMMKQMGHLFHAGHQHHRKHQNRNDLVMVDKSSGQGHDGGVKAKKENKIVQVDPNEDEQVNIIMENSPDKVAVDHFVQKKRRHTQLQKAAAQAAEVAAEETGGASSMPPSTPRNSPKPGKSTVENFLGLKNRK